MNKNELMIKEFVLESTFTAIEPVSIYLRNLLETHGFENFVFQSDLLLRESFTNAAGHGNSLDINKKVKCILRLYHTILEIEIEDEGNGFNWQRDKFSNNDSLKEAQRGIDIYHLYSDQTFFSSQGNHIILRKKLENKNDPNLLQKQLPPAYNGPQNEDAIILNHDLTMAFKDCQKDELIEKISNIKSNVCILDLRNVKIVDSCGIATLIVIYKKLVSRQIKFKLINVSESLCELFYSFNLDRHFEIFSQSSNS